MTIEYLNKLPTTVPSDRVLVHNSVRPTRHVGARGFRVWLSPVAEASLLVRCDCGWAPKVGAHYRVKTEE